MVKNNIENIEKIKISREYLKNNVDELYDILNEQILYHNKYSNYIAKTRKIKLNYILLAIIAIIVVFFVLSRNYNIVTKIVTCIVSFFILVVCYVYTRKMNQKKSIYISKLNERKVEIHFDDFSFKSQFNSCNKFAQKSIYNISSNMGYIFIDSEYKTIIFPLFAVKVKGKYINLYIGKQFTDNLSYKTEILTEEQSKNVKYKKFSYQRWLHQRKDGGPDRRYSYNKLTKYYECNWVYLFGFKFNVLNKYVYDTYFNEVYFPVTDILFDGKVSDYTYYRFIYKAELKFQTKDMLINYLNRRKILFNDYGDTLEIEYNSAAYIINNSGLILDLGKNIREIIEE